MAKETTYEEIARELKNRIYKPVYYLMGEESYYIDRISEYIAQTVLNENEKEFNQTIVYGADTDIATVINAAKRYPMMSKYQVVIVKEAQNIKNIEELVYYLQKPLDSTILVLCHKHGTLDRRKKLAAEIEKVGVLFESKKIKDAQLPGFISSPFYYNIVCIFAPVGCSSGKSGSNGGSFHALQRHHHWRRPRRHLLRLRADKGSQRPARRRVRGRSQP